MPVTDADIDKYFPGRGNLTQDRVGWLNALLKLMRADISAGSGSGTSGPIESAYGAALAALAAAGGEIDDRPAMPPGVAAPQRASGTATIDFGAAPGASDASLNVTGQAIATGAKLLAWLFPAATADHSADEHIVETLNVFAGNIVANTGFTIYGVNTSQLNQPGGTGTRLYGKWNVGWQWEN